MSAVRLCIHDWRRTTDGMFTIEVMDTAIFGQSGVRERPVDI